MKAKEKMKIKEPDGCGNCTHIYEDYHLELRCRIDHKLIPAKEWCKEHEREED